MTKVFLIATAVGSFLWNTAIAAEVQKSTMSGSCENWSLSEVDLKSCNDQMAQAKSDADRMAVQQRFQKGTNASTGTSTGDPTATHKTTGDTKAGILPDQKKNAPGSGTQGAADKKGTPERTP
jgi:hypothetical protein